jgi:putative flippase GtrA
MKKLIDKLCNRETITYLIFGVLTTALNYAIYHLMYRFTTLEPVVYNIVAWTVAVIFAFFTNKLVVFQSKEFKPNTLIKEFFPFIGARIFSFLVEEAFLAITVNLMGMHPLLSKIVICVVVVILNYFFSKFLIFRKKKETSNE